MEFGAIMCYEHTYNIMSVYCLQVPVTTMSEIFNLEVLSDRICI